MMLGGSACLAEVPFSTGPLPRYTSNVIQNDAQGAHSSAIRTKDALSVVEAWMKAHLPAKTTETSTADGAHIFYVPGGATVDVEQDIMGSGTSIAMTWR